MQTINKYLRKSVGSYFVGTACILFNILIFQLSFGQSVKLLPARDQYRAVHWTVEDGLSKERWHNAIFKDVNGFVWIGSNYGELSRFDGNNFKQYDSDKNKSGAIASNNCLTFVEDSFHNIWIGRVQGLSRYDINADTFTNFTSGTSDENIISFWATNNEIFCMEGSTRITTYNVHSFVRKELFQFADTDKINIGFPAACAIFDSASKSIWMLRYDEEGLVQLSLSTGRIIHHPRIVETKKDHHFVHKDAEAMCYDRKRNCIWINSHDGLIQFTLNDQQFHRIEALNQIESLKEYERFVGIDIDPKGRIWFATIPKGIIIYDPSFQSVTQPFFGTTLQREVTEGNLKIYCDRDGMVWTSFWSVNGIYQLIPFSPSVKRYTANPLKSDSLSSLVIYTMMGGDHGSLWIGTPNEGLNIFNPETETFKVWREQDLPGIKGKGIVPMVIDTLRKKVWLNTFPPDRLYEMDMQTKKSKPIVFKDTANRVIPPINVINSMARPFKNGFVFLDVGYGIFEVNKDSAVARQVIPQYQTIPRMTIGESSKLFLRTFGSGIFSVTYNYTNGKWIKTPHLLDSVEWSDIFYDQSDETYWVGVHKELRHYNKDFDKIRTYIDEEGLIGDPLSIIADGRGNIWFNNDRKIIAILNIKTGTISTLSEQDGYQKQSYDWTSPQGAKVGGDLYFAGNFLSQGKIGLDRIQPEKFVQSPPSFVYLNSLKINQHDFPLPTGVNNLQELSLRYFENKISLETGIINYYSRGKSHIRYKLEAKGKNADWEYAPAYYTIRYEDLSPGEYKLVMQASNAANEFNGLEKKVIININPPFWNTWWFRIMAAVLGLSGVLGFVRYRAKNLEERNTILEHKISERTNELNNSLIELKTTQDQLIQSEKMASLGELTSGIAHEIKNPLNFINNFSEINLELLTEIEDDQNTTSIMPVPGTTLDVDIETIKNLKKNSEKINHHGKRVDDIVKGMLQHSRLGNAVKESTNINALCEETLKLAFNGFRSKEKSFHATFEQHYEPNLPEIKVIPQDISRVLLNIINNAFYAVGERSKQLHSVEVENKKQDQATVSNSESEPLYLPTVTVSTKKMDNKISITISDNGIGIPQVIISKIFQPFFTTKPTGEGTGLGLSMAYDIITKSHNGELKVKSLTAGGPAQAGKEGVGTDFEIVLPMNS